MSKRFAFLATTLATIAVAFVGAPALADEPTGRSLPEPLKRILREKACDIPQSDSNANCVDNAACSLKRSNGEAFLPHAPPWFDVFALPWDVGATVFTPMVQADGLNGDEAAFWGTGLSLLSGLPARVDAKGQPDDTWPRVMHANPALVRWIHREFIPNPEEPMCGATAVAVYEQAFKPMVRRLAWIYVELKKSGMLARVPVDELEANVNNRKGRFAKRCGKIVALEKDSGAQYSVDYGCYWWLRRHSGDAKLAKATSTAMLTMLADVLNRYDPEYFKPIAKHFPKLEAAK